MSGDIDERYLRCLDMNEELRKYRGNWKNRDSFAWANQPENAEDWTLVPLRTRDSNLRDNCNAEVIEEEMKGYGNDVQKLRISHFGFGWVEEFAILTIRDGEPTQAFQKWLELAGRLEEYPVLNETLYSLRTTEAHAAVLERECWSLTRDNLPENYSADVYAWLWKHKQAIFDDEKIKPSKDDLVECLRALNFLSLDYEDE